MLNRTKITLGSGFFAAFFVNNGLAAIAIPYYQMILAVDPFLLGVIFTFPVLFSAFLSPTFGQLIDNRFSSSSSRAKLIVFTGWFSAISFSSVWLVPTHWQTSHTLIYLFISSLLFFTSSTILTIAVRTLAFRSVNKPSDINSVMSYTNIFEKFGSLIYFWTFPISQSALLNSKGFGIRYVGCFVGFALIGVLSTISGNFAKYIKTHQAIQPPLAPQTSGHLATALKTPLYILLAITFLQFGLIGSAIFFDFYLIVYDMFNGEISKGAFWKGVLSTAYALVGLISIPILKRIADRWGKKTTLVLVYWLNLVNAIAKYWLFQTGNEYFLIFDAILGAWVWTAMGTLIPGILLDLCRHNQTQTGKAQEAYMLSKQNQALNFGIVFAFLSSGLLLNLIGFNAHLGQFQSEATLSLMRWVLVLGSASVSLVILGLLYKTPFEKFENTN
ncbi:MFS transporter [Paraglaciecola aquimarina]|uniref:MFS transporter n=1 Tax=Paraglaciecola algarum TaxID=3050085 RepID=A0ABS9DCR3_9ALTE|nr:MFS transporter [Paraglaciecola sp. G1-23]MCF2949584.1 MFS transporter [Paraglaciecola sp. G1-23]